MQGEVKSHVALTLISRTSFTRTAVQRTSGIGHNYSMHETPDETLTVGVFAGGLLAALGLTMALNENGSGMGRGSGALLVVTGLAVAWCFCRLLRTQAEPATAVYEPEAGRGGSQAGGAEVRPDGILLDGPSWRIRMRVLSMLVRLQR